MHGAGVIWSGEADMAVNIFHVQFGLNETELTQALESCQYDLAERLIREATSASYLDEGTNFNNI